MELIATDTKPVATGGEPVTTGYKLAATLRLNWLQPEGGCVLI